MQTGLILVSNHEMWDKWWIVCREFFPETVIIYCKVYGYISLIFILRSSFHPVIHHSLNPSLSKRHILFSRISLAGTKVTGTNAQAAEFMGGWAQPLSLFRPRMAHWLVWWQGPHTKAAQGSGGLWGGHQLRGCKDKSASERRCWSFNCSGTVLDMRHESWAVQWDPAV